MYWDAKTMWVAPIALHLLKLQGPKMNTSLVFYLVHESNNLNSWKLLEIIF